jgi:hypothetical protein
LRWKLVFFVPAKESFTLTGVEDDVATGFSLFLALAAFSRAAWSLCAAGPSPRFFKSAALGIKSLMKKSYNARSFRNKEIDAGPSIPG